MVRKACNAETAYVPWVGVRKLLPRPAPPPAPEQHGSVPLSEAEVDAVVGGMRIPPFTCVAAGGGD